MKSTLNYIKKKYPNIPINDFHAYQYYYNYNDVYNKLLLSQLQGIDCSPVGIIPINFPVVIKPIINLYGMSNNFFKINNLEEYNKDKYIGMFWQEYFDGTQYNLDLNIINGKIIQYFCVISIPDENGRFKYHYYEKEYILNNNIIKFIEKILEDYSGFVNIEVINNKIIEMHLRLNGDLFLYSNDDIDKMINGDIIKIKSNSFFPIFIEDFIFNKIDIGLFKKYLDSLNIDYDLDNISSNKYTRICYFRHNDIKKGIFIQNKIYNYIYNNVKR